MPAMAKRGRERKGEARRAKSTARRGKKQPPHRKPQPSGQAASRPKSSTSAAVKTVKRRETPRGTAAPLLFEIAWEVCWQLGGIYTVLRTKSAAMQERWDDRYCLIGPYNPATAAVEFEERPTDGYIRQVLDRLRAMGIPCHYGRW